MHAMQTPPLSVYLKLVCVALFWGGTFIAGRIVSTEVPHMIAAAGRFLVACVFLLLLAWKVEGGLPKLSRQQIHATFGLGATGIFLYNLCFLAALQRMPAGRSALFVSLSPIVTALSMAVLFRERLGLMKWFGIAIAFFGAAIVLTRGDLYQVVHDISATMGSGELFMLAAVGSWTTYTILGKHALQGLSPIAATTYASLWGLLLLSLGAVMQLPQLDATKLTWQVLTSIGFLGIFGTVIGFVWYYEGVKAIGPARTAVFNNLVPVFGVGLSALMLGEPILISMVVGGLLVITGVMITNRPRQ
ncbi:DMT family transporter [Undibacterium sp. LX40W]|uniref:DMT family transporter n=2 Tax=Oxalobacteraceae TaxID=75682 RepID=A0A923KUL5_9BURK|nr:MULTISPECIES: DMT family transporter [Undibacterium]MBC3882347.1 DMT family transporter [Undibacterium nitidum]MBC3892628.1 DMT family transporter [Undibacterium sp. LX40W]